MVSGLSIHLLPDKPPICQTKKQKNVIQAQNQAKKAWNSKGGRRDNDRVIGKQTKRMYCDQITIGGTLLIKTKEGIYRPPIVTRFFSML